MLKQGLKHDSEKPPMSLIPPEAMIYEALVWGKGAKKYGTFNFRNGIKLSRIINGIMRHATAIMLGQDIDPDTGLPNAACIRCGAAMLIAFLDRKELDDRYKGYTKEEVAKYLELMGYTETLVNIQNGS